MTRREAIKLTAGVAFAVTARGAARPPAFSPEWDSLQQYRCPDWFRDAKLGIWAHWGPQCVPEQGDWYARNMYLEGSAHYKHHVAHYGHPSKFGYKDILPLWRAERFDPDAMIRRYKAAGAKYFVALGVHHDNYDCWNSKYHRWNSVQVGPKRDIVGEWARAARRHELRFGVTEHLARSWSWFNVNKGADKQGALAGVPYDGADPKYADLYFAPHTDTTPRYPANPPASYTHQWLRRITDLVDSHQPDLLYTDGGIPFGEVGRSLLAHYYSQNVKWHGGKLEAVYALKDIKLSALGHCGEYRDGVGLLDLERGIVDDIRAEPWQTDTCIGNWYYKRGTTYKTVQIVIQMLADIVSKNGNLLLNIPQRPDGSWDPEAEAVVSGLERWMAVNAEAIHGTRPWREYGEGPKRPSGGQFNEKALQYGAEDIRFTCRGATVYAIALGWPESRTLEIKALGAAAMGGARPISRVAFLGWSGPLKWTQRADALAVELPPARPSEHAFALRIS